MSGFFIPLLWRVPEGWGGNSFGEHVPLKREVPEGWGGNLKQ